MSTDTFIRANNADISVGAPWAYVQSTNFGIATPEILSNRCHIVDVTGNSPAMVANSDMGSPDHLVSVRIGLFTPSGTTTLGLGAAARCNNTGGGGGSGYLNIMNVAAGPVWTLYFLKFTAGVFGGVTSGGSVSLTSLFGGSFVPVAGDIIGLRATGSTFTHYYNGGTVLTSTDTTFATGNFGGLIGSRGSSGVDAAIDLLYLNEDPIVATTFIPKTSTGVLL